MPIALYVDVHIPRAIVEGLRMRHVDVRTAQEDEAAELSDAALLDRATALGRALVTFDDDLRFMARNCGLIPSPLCGGR